MKVNENIKEMINTSSKLSKGNYVYITDLENIIYVSNNNDVCENIHRGVLKKLLSFSITTIHDDYFLTNNTKEIIPIYEKNINKDWKSQIILPISIDDKILGSLIVCNYNFKLDKTNVDFYMNTKDMIEKEILRNT